METIDKPWGLYEAIIAIDNINQFTLKRIIIDPEEHPSDQKHAHRNEIWMVYAGVGTLITESDAGKNVIIIREGDVVHIEKNTWHLIISSGDEPLEFFEIQYGELCAEEDITRRFDKYERE